MTDDRNDAVSPELTAAAGEAWPYSYPPLPMRATREAEQPDADDRRVSGVGPGIEQMHRLVRLEPPNLRWADVADQTGVPHDQSVRWWRAMGFPDVPEDGSAFSADDVEMVSQLETLLVTGLVDDSDVLRLARLMGASFSRLADAQIAAIDELLASLPGADPTDSRQARLAALVESAETDVLEFIEGSMIYVWRRHLLAALGRWLSVDDETSEQAVGFADLSGFSRLSKRLNSVEITDIVETFEAVAFDVVSAREGRVVKLIGDEVMFVTQTVDEAVAISVDLIERLDVVDVVPPIHCGVAFGPTVTVGGDVFGSTVNLAKRLSEAARPGSVTVPREVGRHLLDREDLHVRRLRRTPDLKGVGRTPTLAIRPKVVKE